MKQEEFVELLKTLDMKVAEFSSGNEATFINHPDLPCGIKIFTGDDRLELSARGYAHGLSHFKDIGPKTSVMDTLRLQYEGEIADVNLPLVLELMVPLDDFIQAHDVDSIAEIIPDLAAVELQMLLRGCFVSDLYTKNVGVREQSNGAYRVGILDFGTTVRDLGESLPGFTDNYYLMGEPVGLDQRLNERGYVHYLRWSEFTLKDRHLGNVYQEAFNLEFDEDVSLLSKHILSLLQDHVALIQTMMLHKHGITIPGKHASSWLHNQVRKRTPYVGEMATVVARNHYESQFNAVARQEYDRWFNNQGSGQPVDPFFST
tara:strand:- start:1915 stop:2865 length:951 start_codon:yes stop_codon:yes gene_type:complete